LLGDIVYDLVPSWDVLFFDHCFRSVKFDKPFSKRVADGVVTFGSPRSNGACNDVRDEIAAMCGIACSRLSPTVLIFARPVVAAMWVCKKQTSLDRNNKIIVFHQVFLFARWV